MQYTIGSVNQKAIIENGFKLDLKDCAIIDYCKNFFLSPKIEKIIVGEEVFFWIDYETLIKEMPMLEIESKDVLGRRLRKICEQGILCQRMTKTIGSKTYFRFGENYSKLISDTVNHPTQKSEAPDSKVGDHPTQKSSHINDTSILSSVIQYTDTEGVVHDVFPYFPNSPELSYQYNRYLKHRKEKKVKTTETCQADQIKMLSKLPEQHAIETVKKSIMSGWTGLFPDKINLTFAKKSEVGLTENKDYSKGLSEFQTA